MDYKKIYQQLCQKGIDRVRKVGVFYEKHHIIPRSLGGSNNKNNLTLLTLKEHYIAHRLLVFLYPDSKEMQFALWGMCNMNTGKNKEVIRYKPSPRVYDNIRSEYMKQTMGFNIQEQCNSIVIEEIVKVNNRQTAPISNRKGSRPSEDGIARLRKANKGKKLTEDQLRKRRQGMIYYVTPNTARQNVSKSNKKRQLTPEKIAEMVNASKAAPRIIITEELQKSIIVDIENLMTLTEMHKKYRVSPRRLSIIRNNWIKVQLNINI